MSGTFGRGLWDHAGFIVNNLLPIGGGTYDLGHAQRRFKDLYLSGNADVGGNVAVTGTLAITGATTLAGIVRTVGAALTAAGTTIADAHQIAASINNYTTVASGAGAKLALTTGIGDSVVVKNLGANALLVYPPDVSGVIDAESAGDPVSLAVGEVGTFTRIATNGWIVGVAVAP